MNFDEDLLSEFFPIKLVGGFVSVDFHLGCESCNFCLSRRHPLRTVILEKGINRDFEMTSDRCLELLLDLPSVRDAHVPVRIGHDTDYYFQERQSLAIAAGMPADSPVILMSRRGGTSGMKHNIPNLGRNVLLKLTLTPQCDAIRTGVDWKTALKNIEGFPASVYYLVGPLVEENEKEAEAIIESIPQGSVMGVKELTIEGLCCLDGIRQLPSSRVERLEKIARKKDHTVTRYFGCIIREKIGRGFFKVGDLNSSELEYCSGCASYDKCHGEFDEDRFRVVLKEGLEKTGLTAIGEPRSFGFRMFRLDVAEDSSRGDETYLSEMTGAKLKLSTVSKGSMDGRCVGNSEVLKRWQDIGFFPVEEMKQMAQEILFFISKRT